MPPITPYDWSFSDAVSQLLQASELQTSKQKDILPAPMEHEFVPLQENGSEAKRPHVCHFIGCTRSFGRLEHLKRHIRSHTGERPFACTFNGCQKRFSRFDNMLQHARCHTEKATRRRKRAARDVRRDERVAKHARGSPSAFSSEDLDVDSHFSEADMDNEGESSLSDNDSAPSPTPTPTPAPTNAPSFSINTLVTNNPSVPSSSSQQYQSRVRSSNQNLAHVPSSSVIFIDELPSLSNLAPRPMQFSKPLPMHHSSQGSPTMLHSLHPFGGSGSAFSALPTAREPSNVDSYFLDKLRAASTLASFAFNSLPNELLSGKPALLC